jgi:hypothetical protein
MSQTNITEPNIIEQIDLFNNSNFLQCEEDAAQWEKDYGSYYATFLCCKNISETQSKTMKTAFENFKKFSTNSIEDVISRPQNKLCVLPKGHTCKCSRNPHAKMFGGLLSNKFDTGIYSTPGNDGYIYKNRHSRLFPIAIPDDFERKIKDKTKKLQCAIPLKDYSKPLMLASAYIDYLVFVVNVRNIDSIKVDHEYWSMYSEIFSNHKNKLSEFFGERKRKLFNSDGFSECPVNGYEFMVEDLTRDSRVNPKETDVQLGHCISRKDTRYTIRGFNIALMTREGNRLVGDYDFMDSAWVNKLKTVAERF